MDDLLTTDEVADYLKLAKQTLASWRWEGIGPDYVRVGRRIRYRRSVIDEWLDEPTTPAGCRRGRICRLRTSDTSRLPTEIMG